MEGEEERVVKEGREGQRVGSEKGDVRPCKFLYSAKGEQHRVQFGGAFP